MASMKGQTYTTMNYRSFSKIRLAADFIQNDWPTLKNEITGTLTTVNEKCQKSKQL